MFHLIDYESWDRAEIYEHFHGYLYCMTVEIDITEFLDAIHQNHRKFYPSICYCITRTVNSDVCYRYCRMYDKVGYWDQVNAHYTVMRTASNHLFTHQRTLYDPDFSTFYEDFLRDKALAEAGDSLYFDKSGAMDNVHISIMPNTVFSGLAYSKPDAFTGYGTANISYIPFVMVGKYHSVDGRVKMPVTVEFHHAVNDGYHAEQFFHLLEETCRNFKA